MSNDDKHAFTYDADTFVMGEVALAVDLHKLEADYAELYTEVISDGVITAEKRARLDRAADAVGLPRTKILQIEQAMQAQFETRHHVAVREDIPAPRSSSTAQLIAPPPSVRGPEVVRALAPLDEPGNPRAEAQSARIGFLETENAALKRQLGALETHCAVLEDKLMRLTARTASGSIPAVSRPPSAPPPPLTPSGRPPPPPAARAAASAPPMPGLAPPPPPRMPGGVATPAPPAAGPATPAPVAMADVDRSVLERTLAQNPRDVEALHRFFRALRRSGDVDRGWCVAHALVYLGAADADEKAAHAGGASGTLIQPARSVAAEEWRDLIAGPQADPVVGDILAEIVPPVLLARVTAARREGSRPVLDESQRLDPQRGTQPWARCFGWSAAVLGMAPPPVYADPSYPGTLEMVFGAPPVSRIGKDGLSLWRPRELAFAVGRHLTFYRREYFMSVLAASMKALEELFLAALSIGNPGLPMVEDVRRRVAPIAGAVHPMLDSAAEERLRAGFFRFVEKGGKADLWSWASSTDHAACRAGLLLSSDLTSARTMLALEDPTRVDERMNELLRYSIGPEYAALRRAVGVAPPAAA